MLTATHPKQKMIELQYQNRFFLFADESYATQEYALFFTPDYWQNQNRIIGSAKGRGTAHYAIIIGAVYGAKLLKINTNSTL